MAATGPPRIVTFSEDVTVNVLNPLSSLRSDNVEDVPASPFLVPPQQPGLARDDDMQPLHSPHAPPPSASYRIDANPADMLNEWAESGPVANLTKPLTDAYTNMFGMDTHNVADRPPCYHGPPHEFKFGLYDCTSDMPRCCIGMWLTPCLYGDNYSRLHGTGCLTHCCLYAGCALCACIYGGHLRRGIRDEFSLDADPCNDTCVHLLCSPCAVCQESRELEWRYKKGEEATD